jgi:hypothetical protein
MARVFETQTIDIDFNPSVPITNVNLDKDFEVLAVAVLTNTITPNAHRIVTLGIVYDDAVTSQHSLSVFPFIAGNNIPDAVNLPLNDIQTIQFVDFVDSTIRNDEFISSIITLSTVGAQVNQYSTQKEVLVPSTPITVGDSVAALGTILESRLLNVGSIQGQLGQGQVNSIEVIVTQS